MRNSTSHLVFATFLLGTGWLYLSPLASGGVLIAGDHPFHLALTYAVQDNWTTHRSVLGWSESAFGGFPVFSAFVPAPAGYLAVLALHGVSGMAVPGAYKMVVAISVLLPAAALWVFLRARFDLTVTFAIANLFVVLSYSLVQPLRGSWAQYLAIGFLVLLCHVALTDGERGGRWLPAATVAGLGLAAILTDPVVWPVIALAGAWCVALRGRRGTRRAPAGIALGCVWALAVAASLAALLAARLDWGVPPGVEPATVLGQAARIVGWFLAPGAAEHVSEYLVPAMRGGHYADAAWWVSRLGVEHAAEAALGILGVAGWVTARSGLGTEPEGRRTAVGHARFLLPAMVLLVVAPWRFVPGLASLPGVGGVDPMRFVPYVNLCLLILSAHALHIALHRAAGRAGSVALVVVVAVAALHAVRHATYRDHVPVKTAARSVIHTEMEDVWRWLRERVEPGSGRVLYQEIEGIGFLDGGYAGLGALSMHETGLASIVGGRLYTHVAFRQPGLVAGANPFRTADETVRFMQDWNCSHVVVWHPGLRHRLLATGAVTVAHESLGRLFTVLALGSSPGWVEFDEPVEGLEVEPPGSGRWAFRFHASEAGTRVTVKTNYHPGWSFRVNGSPAEAVRNGDRLAVDDLPAGDVAVECEFRGSRRGSGEAP